MTQRTSKDEEEQITSGAVSTTNLIRDSLTQEHQVISPVVGDENDLYSAPPSTSSAARKIETDALQECGEGASGSRSMPTTILECPICLQICIHPARLPCGHIFCFLCIKGVAYKNRRCAMCRREIPPEFLDHPQLVNGIEDIFSTKTTEDGFQWFYEGRNGWWQYDERTSQDIEEAYKKEEKSCTILVAGYVYTVDLEAMVQQRQNEPTRCRRVKRDLATIPKKGVAGLRIEGNTVTTDSNFTTQLYEQTGQQIIALDDNDESVELRLPVEYDTLPTNANAFISTIAATDAAVRIASDIIGSTLAHADELSRNNRDVVDLSSSTDDSLHSTGENPNDISDSSDQGISSSGAGEMSAVALGSHELPEAAEYLLDTTQNTISDADAIDLFQQTLNDFHALTLRNITHSSDEEEEVAGSSDRKYPHRHMKF